ncbi:Trk K+ transport system NAD-binding subunit [Propionicimonas paludicola]|uniref:Trk K+ transport system NAD-binding subunit n=1 Tax=Propionicimonas paludicola TaxID=185243 RepID=A0A2A9CUB7_9ACTN|nr:NAD-binding protein [Propionicimonas paludicola]PFG17978.1 Trk K+ transport system NAD-binding subunit [Propionicimonas paludicola]
MSTPGVKDRVRYWFDNQMSKGLGALMVLLGLATAVFVLVLVALAFAARAFPGDAPDADPLEMIWAGLMHALDAGAVGGDTGWAYRGVMLLVTVGGLVIVASLIGIVSSAFDEKVAQLRKGHSLVLEEGHTLILGWSNKVCPIINELAKANESRPHASVVVLANKDKVEMDDQVKRDCQRLGGTAVICRTGDPRRLAELQLARPHLARSIIVLAPEGSHDPDVEVIKAVLAIVSDTEYDGQVPHIVAELSDPANLEAAKLAGQGRAHWVVSQEVIGKIIVQTCRQSGLSVVYQEFLDFDGDEIYLVPADGLVGRTYFDAQCAFPRCAVMGLFSDGIPRLNPPADTVIGADDQIILVAVDDSAVRIGPEPDQQNASEAPGEPPRMPKPERVLVLGVNQVLPMMLAQLDEYVGAGSEAVVVTPGEPPAMPGLGKLAVHWIAGDPTKRSVLEGLGVGGFDHIILLADVERYGAERADSRTLVTLLHLRNLAAGSELELNIVSEMLDDRNRELAEVARADDLIVSDKLVALMLCQISENKHLAEVFTTLFESQGSEVYLKPARNYVEVGHEVDFYGVLNAARQYGETAIGYRIAAQAHDADQSYGVRLNPEKSAPVVFGRSDRIIVLAES